MFVFVTDSVVESDIFDPKTQATPYSVRNAFSSFCRSMFTVKVEVRSKGPVDGKIHEYPRCGEIRVDMFSLQKREDPAYRTGRG